MMHATVVDVCGMPKIRNFLSATECQSSNTGQMNEPISAYQFAPFRLAVICNAFQHRYEKYLLYTFQNTTPNP